MIKFLVRTFVCVLGTLSTLRAEDRIPFYEDFIESGNLKEFIELAHNYLDENPDAKEAPRLALDLIMMGKASEDLKSVVRGTDLLLFQYLGTLPSLHFISSFDKGSPRLAQLLKVKLDEANLSDQNFSNSFADTIVLLNRIHGAQLMNDPSLLLSSYLVVQGSNNEQLLDDLSEALDTVEKNIPKYGALISLCRSEAVPLSKIAELHKITGLDTDFVIKFFTAQLTPEQRKSPEFLEIMINSTLFGSNKKPELALSYLSSLPDESATLPKYQVCTAFAHLINGNSETSLSLLKSIAQNNGAGGNADPWREIADSMSDGTEFGESRKTLFLDQLQKLFASWQRENEIFVIEGSWNKEDSENGLIFKIGINKKAQSFEIHFQKNKNPFFSYKVDSENCQIFTPSGKNILFTKPGAFPLPKIEVKRDTDAGSFNYSFNLNFGKSFDEFAQQVSENIDISYLSTTKGREVLLNHIIERQGLWFSPPASSDQGTVFTIHRIDPEEISRKYKIEISPAGKLISLSLGKLEISNFTMGSSDSSNLLPQWPESSELSKSDDFQLSILVESIGELIKTASPD